MSSIERRIQKAEKCIGINEASEVDTLTDEELEEIRTALRIAFESGVPLTLPPVRIGADRRQVP